MTFKSRTIDHEALAWAMYLSYASISQWLMCYPLKDTNGFKWGLELCLSEMQAGFSLDSKFHRMKSKIEIDGKKVSESE